MASVSREDVAVGFLRIHSQSRGQREFHLEHRLFLTKMSFTSRWATALPRTGAAVLRSRISTLPVRPTSRHHLATPSPLLFKGFSSSPSNLAKKSKKGNNKSEEVDDDATMVIRTKGKASRKSATLVSAANSNTGSSRRGAAGEEPIESDVESGDAHDDAVIEKAKVKMEKTVSWFKSVVFDGVERGKGRITPGTSRVSLASSYLIVSSSSTGSCPSTATGL
jgi:hypothetical protein